MPTELRRSLGHLLVCSEQTLVADSVRAALRGRGLTVVVLPWPRTGARGRGVVVPPGRGAGPADVGLLISELDSPARVRAARTLLLEVPARWLMMTGAESGPAWGAVLEAGARLVVPSSLSLDEVYGELHRVAGDAPLVDAGWRARLVASWARRRREQETLARRIDSLTPQEREVLRLLHTGAGVAEIAAMRSVRPSTVRSQVRAVLRKLYVSSQLAAVSRYDAMDGDDPPPPS